MRCAEKKPGDARWTKELLLQQAEVRGLKSMQNKSKDEVREALKMYDQAAPLEFLTLQVKARVKAAVKVLQRDTAASLLAKLQVRDGKATPPPPWPGPRARPGPARGRSPRPTTPARPARYFRSQVDWQVHCAMQA